jgi:hypothetical protein
MKFGSSAPLRLISVRDDDDGANDAEKEDSINRTIGRSV